MFPNQIENSDFHFKLTFFVNVRFLWFSRMSVFTKIYENFTSDSILYPKWPILRKCLISQNRLFLVFLDPKLQNSISKVTKFWNEITKFLFREIFSRLSYADVSVSHCICWIYLLATPFTWNHFHPI